MRKRIILLLFLFPLFQNCEVTGDPEMLELLLEIKNQNEELLNEVKSLQSKSDSLINELKNSAAQQEELLKKVNELQVELSTILSQINVLSEKLNSQDEDFESIRNQLADLQEKYQAILDQLEQLQKLSQILAEIEVLKGQLSELDGKYEVILNGLSQNQEELQALKNQIENLQAQLAENLSKISELTSLLGDQGADIENILVQIEELKASCADIKKLLESQLAGKSPIPTNELLMWYPFNGNANDESGNKFDGFVSNAIISSDRNGKNNSAYSFDVNQSITITGTESLNPFPMTISLWYNVFSLGKNSSPIIKKYRATTWNGFMIGVCDCRDVPNGSRRENNGFATFPWYLRSFQNRIIGYYTEPPFLQSNISFNKWYHYVFVVDETGGKIYVDGELIETDIWTGDAGKTNSSLLLQIGGLYEGDGWFKGKIDDVAIWNRALESEEILKIFNGEGF
ncbi:MAG: LamG-like jellyroll fold domain-containing protein [Bacteroidota bacterium]